MAETRNSTSVFSINFFATMATSAERKNKGDSLLREQLPKKRKQRDDTSLLSEDKQVPQAPANDGENLISQPQSAHVSAQVLSDSNSDEELCGFTENQSPITKRKKKIFKQSLPPWLNANVPPGPWQQMAMPAPYYPYWPNMPMAMPPHMGYGDEPEDLADLSEDDALVTEVAIEENIDEEIDLAKHLAKADKKEDVGPPVNGKLASLVEKIWGSSLKGEIKDLYDDATRPANTPSLQRVELDQEIRLKDQSKVKRMDTTLRNATTALIKSAIKMTRMVDSIMKCEDPRTLKQQLVDEAIDSIRILSYGTTNLNEVRRENIKYMISDPEVRTRLCKNRDPEQVNTTHCLFGGDVSKQAKEGNCHLIE